ncbi:MAG: phosphoglycerate kinase, partial [Nitrosopumilus sp. CG10_big_fil_rev_8_21_14_0_10_33_7]
QGRPGEDGFISLKRHSDHIRKFIDKPLKFVSWEDDYVSAIKEMKNGEVIVLDNPRLMKEEQEKKTPVEHAKDGFIKNLGPLGDL